MVKKSLATVQNDYADLMQQVIRGREQIMITPDDGDDTIVAAIIPITSDADMQALYDHECLTVAAERVAAIHNGAETIPFADICKRYKFTPK